MATGVPISSHSESQCDIWFAPDQVLSYCRQAKEELRALQGMSSQMFAGSVDDLMNGLNVAS